MIDYRDEERARKRLKMLKMMIGFVVMGIIAVILLLLPPISV